VRGAGRVEEGPLTFERVFEGGMEGVEEACRRVGEEGRKWCFRRTLVSIWRRELRSPRIVRVVISLGEFQENNTGN
jgi:hypothetical protein